MRVLTSLFALTAAATLGSTWPAALPAATDPAASPPAGEAVSLTALPGGGTVVAGKGGAVEEGFDREGALPCPKPLFPPPDWSRVMAAWD